ncbi:MAG: hypothetical protein DDT32_02256 [Syntrophomonadaceae bacterium]|nr:hypothetical protein [Bacillota bacterium]
MQNERQLLIRELATDCSTIEEVHEKLRDLFKGDCRRIAPNI